MANNHNEQRHTRTVYTAPSSAAHKTRKKTQATGKPPKSVGGTVAFIVGVALCALLLPILLVNIAIIVKSIVQPNQFPTVFGVAPMAVLSDSMHTGPGTIARGDLVLTMPVRFSEIQVGQIVLYQRGNTVVMHRVERIENQDGARVLITKGDANNAEDLNPVLESQVVGGYWRRIPKLGHLVFFMQQPLGIILFVALPVALFLFLDRLRHKRELQHQRMEKIRVQNELQRLKDRRVP